MKRSVRQENAGDGSRRRKRTIALLLLLVLLLLLLLWWFLQRRQPPEELQVSGTAVVAATDSLVQMDSSGLMDTAAVVDSPMVAPVDTVVRRVPSPRPASTPKNRAVVHDTVHRDSMAAEGTGSDTAAADSLAKPVAAEEDRCGADTADLWVYPDPSGGIHYRAVAVEFHANRPAKVHYQFQGDTGWTRYTGSPVTVAATTTLFFDAIDSCGNVMERRSEYYEIETSRVSSDCPQDMEPVRVGTMNFCIDRYEWPNRRGEIPRSYVSLYQATDSCFAAGKRLCTLEEWTVACTGPYTWKYPYGQKYEPSACGTHDTVVAPSGSRPECRGYFGIFDMSGNLLEWTSTRAAENSSFYYVTGGFWESGPKSACNDKRYSYYPQNRHNPVGFRCCSDIRPAQAPKGRR